MVDVSHWHHWVQHCHFFTRHEFILFLFYFVWLDCRPSGEGAEGQSLGQGLADLEEAREEVVAQVLNAPKRRVDNEVSRLSDSVCVLQMHCKIIEDIGLKYQSALFRYRISVSSAFFASVVVPSSALLGMALVPGFAASSGLSTCFILGYPAVAVLGATAGDEWMFYTYSYTYYWICTDTCIYGIAVLSIASSHDMHHLCDGHYQKHEHEHAWPALTKAATWSTLYTLNSRCRCCGYRTIALVEVFLPDHISHETHLWRFPRSSIQVQSLCPIIPAWLWSLLDCAIEVSLTGHHSTFIWMKENIRKAHSGQGRVHSLPLEAGSPSLAARCAHCVE